MIVEPNMTAVDVALSFTGSITGLPVLLRRLPVGQRIGFDTLPAVYDDVSDVGQTWTPLLTNYDLGVTDFPMYNVLGAEKAPFTTDLFALEAAVFWGIDELKLQI